MGQKTNERALGEFVKTVGEIDKVLSDINAANDGHYDLVPDKVNWGNVGDAKRTLASLQEILDVIRGEVK